MSNDSNNGGSIFNSGNYIVMLAGIAIIVIGFVLMSGGGQTDPSVFNADEIYSARRITIAPMLVLIGFGLEIYAIFFQSGADA